MQGGTGLAGFIASSDEERFISQYPTFLIGLTPTTVEGELGFGLVAWDRTNYVSRENGKDFAGTTTTLWAISTAVFLSLAGPAGMRELGEVIAGRCRYAAELLAAIPGVAVPSLTVPFFKEFVVDFSATRLTSRQVNEELRRRGILGGVELNVEAGGRASEMLVCVTEVHRVADIELLVQAVADLVAAAK